MAENTKLPPNQDQRQRTSQGGMDKPSKPAGNSNKPENKPEIDPDRNRTGRGQPIPEGDEERVVDDGDIDGEEIEDEFGDEIEDDEDTAPTQRVDRGTRGDRQ